MLDLENFYNDGFGWVCRQCERELASLASLAPLNTRIFLEGEAEDTSAKSVRLALAQWTDKTRRNLTCPRCSVTEAVELS